MTGTAGTDADAVRHARAKAVFLAVTAAPRGERDAVLARECRSDRHLRSEVEALLASDEQPHGQLDEVFLGVPLPLTTFEKLAGQSCDDVVTETLVGRQLGGYRIIEVIGQGGMGIVFRAAQDNPRRMVALKVLRSGLMSAGEASRFRRETRILARLHHPGIAQIYQAGTADGGLGEQPYFAMELVDGPALLDHAARAGLSRNERLEVFAQVCDAVAAAHAAGVIHRDIKPSNVLVDAEGRPKLIDFGVALDPTGERGDGLTTRTGQVLGTLQYMSPEQVRGEVARLDQRSDVYSLGLLLYELLAGRKPYDVKDASTAGALRVICRGPPVRPSRIDPSLGGDVEAVLLMALEKQAERRYAKASALAEDVRRVCRGDPVSARHPGAWRRVSAWVRRHPGRAVIGGPPALLVLIAIATAAWLTVDISSAHREAKTSWSEGRLPELRQTLQRAPSALDGLLPSDLAPIADAIRKTEGDTPLVQVLEALDGRGRPAAFLLTARYIERDGLEAHPALTRFLLQRLGAERDEDVQREALPVVARLFFDRPDSSWRALSSAPFRTVLHELLAGAPRGHGHLDVLTALSGCGNVETVGVILDWLESRKDHGSLDDQIEEARLALRAVEAIVCRSHSVGLLADLARSEADRIERTAAAASRRLAAKVDETPFFFPMRTVLRSLFAHTERLRRAAGLPPGSIDSPDTGRFDVQLARAMRDPTREMNRLLGDYPEFLRTAPTPDEQSMIVYWTVQALEGAELLNSNPALVGRLVALGSKRGLAEAGVRSVIASGIADSQNAAHGLREAWIPDKDTQLGWQFHLGDAPISQVLPVDMEQDGDHVGVLAAWDFRGPAKARISGGASTVASANVLFELGENAPWTGHARLGPESRLDLEFEGRPSFRIPAQFSLRIHAYKATRRILPYLGQAWLRIQVDGREVGHIPIELGPPLSVQFPWGTLAGSHHLSLELTDESNTTVRINRVAIEAVPEGV